MLVIPPLTSSNYTEWIVACTSAAKKCLPTNGPLGGMGLLLSTEEYTHLSGNAYEPAVKPTTVNNAQYTHQQAVYDREQVCACLPNACHF